jgi:hypothetical protein
MHCVDLPAIILGENRINDRRSDYSICLEGNDELQVGEIGIWSSNLWRRVKEVEVPSSSLGE